MEIGKWNVTLFPNRRDDDGAKVVEVMAYSTEEAMARARQEHGRDIYARAGCPVLLKVYQDSEEEHSPAEAAVA